MKKLLVAPPLIATIPYIYIFDKYFHRIKKKLSKFINFSHKLKINGELRYYGEFFNSSEMDVYCLGQLHPIYYTDNLDEFKSISNINNYPHNFNFPKPKMISLNYVKEHINDFDFFLCSNMSLSKYFDLIKIFKKRDIAVGIFDQQDNIEIYYDKANVFRNIDEKYFDLYFKQDLPLEFIHDKAKPVCPMPANDIIFNSKLDTLPSNKKIPFSFFGKSDNRTMQDREDICDFIKEEYPNSVINLRRGFGGKFIPIEEMNAILDNTIINLSPSGITWNSYRHSDMVEFSSPILIPKPNIQTISEPFVDMKNCIMYETKLINNKFRLINKRQLKEKLNEVLKKPEILYEIYENYRKFILKFHTRKIRSNQILEEIKKFI